MTIETRPGIGLPTKQFIVPRFDGIPPELKALPWCAWKGEPRDNGKVAKAPRNPLNLRKIGTDKPEQWGSLDEAQGAYEAGRADGVGILLPGSELVGVDLDDFRSLAKAHPAVGQIVLKARAQGVYMEHSPSGNGLHLLVHGQLARGVNRGGIELYQERRHLSVTGRGSGAIKPAQWVIDGLLQLVGAGDPRASSKPAEAGPIPPDTIARIARAIECKHPDLWRGDWEVSPLNGKNAALSGGLSSGHESQSDADFHMCCEIARGGLREGIERGQLHQVVEGVFSLCGLAQRDKWTDRDDYRARTVGRAIEAVVEEADKPSRTGGAEPANGTILECVNERFALIQTGGRLGVIDREHAARATSKHPLEIISVDLGKTEIMCFVRKHDPQTSANSL